MAGAQPLKIAIMAMGGEGGGVLADWLVDLGEANGHLAQTTSVPGVAQRTGATIYYVELFPAAQAARDGATPVLALMPLPGDVDVVLASELMEGGRAVQRGLVTPDRTTLIASTHRIYSIAEKSELGDGRVDSGVLLAHAAAAAKRFVSFDMAEIAEQTGSVISAVLFGALAGTGVLPFSRAQFEATIARGGVGVAPSLKAFATAYARAAGLPAPPAAAVPDAVDGALAAPASAALDGATEAPPADQTAGGAKTRPAAKTSSPSDPRIRALLEKIEREFPAAAQPMLREGIRRLIDFQDSDYAFRYLDRLGPVAAAAANSSTSALLDETARHLALWMSYEDTARVAQLKIRGARFDRVRAEVRVAPDQMLGIDEYFHPRVQEIAETLPAAIGRVLERPGWPRHLVERLTRRGRIVTTTSLAGYLLLASIAGARRWRRSTTRYTAESGAIDEWLRRIVETARTHPALAVEVAQCQRLVKGYSDTRERGIRNFQTVMAAVEHAGASLAPATLRELRDAALADEHGTRLSAVLERHALA